MSIIEKLGITEGPWMRGNYIEMISGNNERDMRVFSAAPEMLEALKDEWVFIEKCLAVWADSIDESFRKKLMSRQLDLESIIQKATKKTWEEIKEIIENE